jgi:hypothetical protein
MAKRAVFGQSCFCMNNKQRTGKKSIGAEKPWRENSGAYLEQKTEEPGCQA